MIKRATLLLALLLCLTRTGHCFCFEEAGQRYNIPPELLWTIAKHESGLKPDLVNYNTNGSYDYGLMGINSSWEPTLRKMGIPWSSLSNTCTNVMTGAWILRQCIDDYGYGWKAVGCYNSRTPSKRDIYAQKIAAKMIRYSLLQPVGQQKERWN